MRNVLLAVLVAFAAAAVPARAASPAFLDIAATGTPDELPATTLAAAKPFWIQVTSWTYGSGRPVVAPGTSNAVAGGPTSYANSLDVTVPPDAATKLFEFAAAGTPIKVVRLYVFRPSPKGMVPTYVVTLTNAIVTSSQWKGTTADRPTSNITFDCQRIETQWNSASSAETPGTPTYTITTKQAT